jgi:prolyl-tRNA synthetase
LQAGTSHFLGQNFAKAFDVKYATKEGGLEHVWATSWGVSTRLMGALIMTHSDDNGLVLPPALAPHQVVIVPIYRGEEEQKMVSEAVAPIVEALRKEDIRVHFDNRDTHKPGFKFNEYELKGVPLRIGIGPRDVANGTVELARRDTLSKSSVAQEGLVAEVKTTLAAIQFALFDRAKNYRDEHTTAVDDFDAFKDVLASKGGFVAAHWDGTAETELAIKEATKATIRCIPIDGKTEQGNCVYSGKPSNQRVLFAKAY